MANICRYCKNKLPEGAKRCPSCGKAVVNTCAECGTRIYNDEKYCPGCGAAILVNCGNCGEKIYSGERFCPYCGSKNGKGNPHAAAVSQVNVPISLPVVPPVMPPTGYGMPFMGDPQMYGGMPGAPIMLPPIMLGPNGQPVSSEHEEEKHEKLVRTRPAPVEETVPETKVIHDGIRVGTVGLILSLISLLLPFLSIISFIVSCVGIHKDKKRGRGIAPGVFGLIISLIIILAIVALVIWALQFGGWDVILEVLGNLGVK